MTDMKQPCNFTRDKLAEFVAAEVEHILAKYDRRMSRAEVVAGGKLAGAIVVAYANLSHSQMEAVGRSPDEIAEGAAKFVSGLAKDAETKSPALPDVIARDQEEEGEIPKVPIRVDDWAGPTAGPTYLEANYGISRSTLHRWQRRNAVVALRTGGRKHVFPLEQFIDGRPVNGIEQVAALIPHPRFAWLWLIQPNEHLNWAKPIEMLRADLMVEVVAAAKRHAEPV